MRKTYTLILFSFIYYLLNTCILFNGLEQSGAPETSSSPCFSTPIIALLLLHFQYTNIIL